MDIRNIYKMVRLAIHQPNFFPHYPFFQKMAEVDIFIILSRCQFEKNNYQNRFNYKDKWHTMAVPHGLVPICEKEYLDPFKDWKKIKDNLPEFNLGEFDGCIERNLASTNTNIIRKIKKELGIQTALMEDYPTNLTGTARLVDICKTYGATHYLSGVSGINYMDLELFERNGIEVEYQSKSESKPIIEVIYE